MIVDGHPAWFIGLATAPTMQRVAMKPKELDKENMTRLDDCEPGQPFYGIAFRHMRPCQYGFCSRSTTMPAYDKWISAGWQIIEVLDWPGPSGRTWSNMDISNERPLPKADLARSSHLSHPAGRIFIMKMSGDIDQSENPVFPLCKTARPFSGENFSK